MTQPRLVGDRYELGELIGYGGMAEVHRGRDVRLGREVAIKILRADLARDPSFLNRFRREAQSAAGLNHPAIVAVYDTGEDVGPDGAPVPFIVMEFVAGRTLREILKAEGPLPPRRALEIVAEVAGALDFSHRHGLIHRDVKPANVMITRAGGVKVMDFGIARAMSDDAATVTQTAAVIGTAQYLSPEQARGEAVDGRSDVYSSGCLLYELLTGKPPFQGDSPVAVAYQHVRENAPAPSTLNANLPPAIDSIVMKALAKNPLNRYQTAGEMREDLVRALANQPVQAESVLTDADRTQYIARSAAVPPVARGGVPLGDDYDYDDAHPNRGAVVWIAVVVALLAVIGVAAYFILHSSSDKTPQVQVPNLIGQSPAVAESYLRNAGLVPGSPTNSGGPCGTAASPVTVQPGQVCTQDQTANVELAKNSTVNFTIYQIPTVSVPTCQGGTYSDCAKQLQQLHLIPKETLTDNSTSPAGTVLTQNPMPFTQVAQGQAVTVTVASGKFTVPNEIGKTAANAQNDLNSAGWANVTTVNQPTTNQAQDGNVINQSPRTGTYAQSQQITLTIGVYTPPTPSTGCSSTSSPPPTDIVSTSPPASPTC